MKRMLSRNTLTNAGLLVLRIGIGMIFIIHGVPKLMGGVKSWIQLGSTMSIVGVSFTPAFWGFMAVVAEVLGGLFIVLGLMHRFVALFLMFTMIIALLVHVTAGDPFAVYSNALKALVVFIALLISGPGIYSFDYKYFRRIS